MSGEASTIYILARRTLLDAVNALGAHGETIVLIGAQAIYLHTGDADLDTAPFTTDADFAIDPNRALGLAAHRRRDGRRGLRTS